MYRGRSYFRTKGVVADQISGVDIYGSRLLSTEWVQVRGRTLVGRKSLTFYVSMFPNPWACFRQGRNLEGYPIQLRNQHRGRVGSRRGWVGTTEVEGKSLVSSYLKDNGEVEGLCTVFPVPYLMQEEKF